MFLRHKASNDLVEVMDLPALFDPFKSSISARLHAGEDMQDTEDFVKSDLAFPSGEALPVCWVDPNYKS